jgi:thiol-disulfide isomerase/thioredoxin
MKTLLSLIALLLMTSVSFANTDLLDENKTGEIKVIAVKMDAEWCGKCRVMNPKLKEVMPLFKGEPVLFVKFDMTNEFTTEQSGLLAERLQLSGLFNNHKGRTGFMVLVDAENGTVLKTLQSDLSNDQIITAIQKLL